MQLGAFSVSLAVKDLAASRAFYETLGFEQIGGEETENWLILRNGPSTIGLFAGMFEGSILTFNPGWSQDNQPLESFNDVREIQQHLKDAGITLDTEVEPGTSGPGYFTLTDPDGNAIMLDQHI